MLMWPSTGLYHSPYLLFLNLSSEPLSISPNETISYSHIGCIGEILYKSIKGSRTYIDRSTFWAPHSPNFIHWKNNYSHFTLSKTKHGESIVIGLAASSTSKGPQVKPTEPMVKIKVTNYSIQLGWILARGGFAPEAQKCHFFI